MLAKGEVQRVIKWEGFFGIFSYVWDVPGTSGCWVGKGRREKRVWGWIIGVGSGRRKGDWIGLKCIGLGVNLGSGNREWAALE